MQVFLKEIPFVPKRVQRNVTKATTWETVDDLLLLKEDGEEPNVSQLRELFSSPCEDLKEIPVEDIERLRDKGINTIGEFYIMPTDRIAELLGKLPQEIAMIRREASLRKKSKPKKRK